MNIRMPAVLCLSYALNGFLLGAVSNIASADYIPQASILDNSMPSRHKSWNGIKQFGSVGEERGYASTVDKQGNLYVTGYTSGDLDGDGPGTNAGGYDLYVMKLNSLGETQWILQMGSPNDDKAHLIALDHKGNIYVTGHAEGDLDGTGTQVHSGEGDPFLLKLDGNGQIHWMRQFGTVGDEFGFGLAVDNLGNPYVTGYTSGDMDGDGPGMNAGLDDVFLVAFDTSGNERWVRQVGSLDYDVGYAVTTDIQGYIYVTGFSLGDLDGLGAQVNAGSWDTITLKFDWNGELNWIRQLGTAGDDFGYAVAIDRNRHLYISGFVSGDFDGNGPDSHAGGSDIVTIKMRQNGKLVWSRQLGVEGDDVGFGVSVDRSGAVYTTGVVSGDLDGPGSQTYQGALDVVAFKLASNGKTKWIRQWGTPTNDLGFHITVDRKNHIYITGETQGDLDGPGPQTHATHAGDFDAFILKLRCIQKKLRR